jgi:hypothetical protein
MESDILTRLKRVPAKQTTTLTHYERKTGKPFEVTIWFVLDGETVYLGNRERESPVGAHLPKTPKVRLSIDGETFDGTFPRRPRGARTRHGGHSAEFLDVSTVHCAGEGSPAIGVMRNKANVPRL